MKKWIVIGVTGILVLAALFMLATGLQKRSDVALMDFVVADDGATMTLKVCVTSSSGYVRTVKEEGGGVKPYYLTFYSTFGGFNSSLGAADTFVLTLSPDDTEIYFNRSGGGYELVLEKNEITGEWERPAQ